MLSFVIWYAGTRYSRNITAKIPRTIADITTLEIMSFRELLDFDTISSGYVHMTPMRAFRHRIVSR